MKNVLNNRVIPMLKVIFPLILLILAGSEIQKFAKDLDVGLLQCEMNQIGFLDMLIALIVVAAALTPMFFYDAIIVKLLRIELPRRKLVKQSLIANTFSNLLGFGGLIGLMIRTYFYQPHGMERKKLLTTIASVSLFYLTGISLLAWIILLAYGNIPLLVNTKWIYLAVIGVGLYLPVLLFVIHKNKDMNLSIQTRSKLVLISLCEWTAIFFVIWFLTKILHIQINFHDLFSVFIVVQ